MRAFLLLSFSVILRAGELRLLFFMKLTGVAPNYTPEPTFSDYLLLIYLFDGLLVIFISLTIWDLTVGSFPISDSVLTK